jgi:hypothetical protein
MCKKKVKFALEQTMKAQKGKRSITTLSLTLALYWDGWLTVLPGHFIPGERYQYPSCRRLDGPQARSGLVRKISLPNGQNPNRQAYSKSLYWLLCLAPHSVLCVILNINRHHFHIVYRINPLRTKLTLLYLKTQLLQRSQPRSSRL